MFEINKYRHFSGEAFVIKIGSGALAGPDGLPNEKFLTNVISSITAAKRSGAFIVLVTSGALSTGQALYGNEADEHVLAGLGQAALMRCYGQILTKHDMHAVPLMVDQRHLQDPVFTRRLNAFRDHHAVLPILNEQDVLADPHNRFAFADNDILSAKVSIMLRAEGLIMFTTPGPSIGRGGWQTKLEACDLARQAGIDVHVTSLRDAGVIGQILKRHRPQVVRKRTHGEAYADHPL